MKLTISPAASEATRKRDLALLPDPPPVPPRKPPAPISALPKPPRNPERDEKFAKLFRELSKTAAFSVPARPVALGIRLQLVAAMGAQHEWATNRNPLVADTGVGKTNFIMAMIAAMADSCGFLHWLGSVRPIRLVLVEGEISLRLVKSRLEDMVRWCERIHQRCTSLAIAI